MARIRFYTDEQVARAVVRGLRRRGVDVLTVPEAGTLGVSDAEQLHRARDEERVIFTQDDDFLRLAAEGANHAGIVYASILRSSAGWAGKSMEATPSKQVSAAEPARAHGTIVYRLASCVPSGQKGAKIAIVFFWGYSCIEICRSDFRIILHKRPDLLVAILVGSVAMTIPSHGFDGKG